MTLSKVDLPQPLGPIRQISSPRAISSEVPRQECFGVELAHVGLLGKGFHLHEGFAQHRKRLGLEAAAIGKHRHKLVVDAAGGGGVRSHDFAGDRQRVGLVLAHEGDGLEPALQKGAQRLWLARDRLVGGKDHMDMKILHQFAETQQDLAFAALNEVERLREVDDGGVDRLGLERGDAVGVVADRDLRHAVVAPALLPRHLADDPARHRANGRDPDLAALEIIDRRHRAVVAHDQGKKQRRPGHGCDAFRRRALDDERQAGARAEPDVDAVCRHRLLQPRIAAETADLDLDAVVLEDAGARADIGRYEGKRVAPRFAHAQRLGGVRRSCRCQDESCEGESEPKPRWLDDRARCFRGGWPAHAFAPCCAVPRADLSASRARSVAAWSML